MQEERFAHLHHRDNETSLDPTLYRMFSSNQGRWFTPDPIVGQTANPQTLNRFSYVEDDPVAGVDSTGLYPVMFGGCLYDQVDFFVNGVYDSSSADLIGCGLAANVGRVLYPFWNYSAGSGGGAVTRTPPPPSPTPPSPPQQPPNPAAQATIHGSYLQWWAFRLNGMRSELGASMIEHGLNLESPNLPADLVEAALRAGASCLRMFPLAALDPAYNGPAAGDVFYPPPFPLSLYGY